MAPKDPSVQGGFLASFFDASICSITLCGIGWIMKLSSLHEDKWMGKVEIKRPGICTGEKLGSETCPKGSSQYALAKTFKKGSETSARNRKKK